MRCRNRRAGSFERQSVLLRSRRRMLREADALLRSVRPALREASALPISARRVLRKADALPQSARGVLRKAAAEPREAITPATSARVAASAAAPRSKGTQPLELYRRRLSMLLAPVRRRWRDAAAPAGQRPTSHRIEQ